MRLLLLLLVLAAPARAQPAWERKLWFHPARGSTPAPRGWKAETVVTDDRLQLRAWWRPAPPGQPTLLSFHGNGGNLGILGLPPSVEQLGWGALLLDYRGYGESQGEPSEAGLYSDARAAYAAVLRHGVPTSRLLIHGQSLGGAVAAHLAAERPCAGLLLESTFSSAGDMAVHFRGPAARGLIQARFDSLGAVARSRCPLLVLHGDSDELIPWQLGRRLFEAAGETRLRRWWLVPGAGHNNLRALAGEAFLTRLRDFARGALRSPPATESGRRRDG